MATAKASKPDKIVDEYFRYIKELRAGKENAVGKLVDLWEEDGVFEFAGAPPVTGTFKGRAAIHTLYQNRVKAGGMQLMLQGREGAARATEEVALGTVDTKVHRVRTIRQRPEDKPERIVAGWTTVIGTSDKRGFEVSGSHTFTFKDGRISALKVVISPKPDESGGLSMEKLSVDDIGRLALAAWPVV